MVMDIFERSQAARTSILNKLKQQVEGADYSKLPAEKGFCYPQLPVADMLENFVEHLQANHAQVISVSAENVYQVAINQLRERGIEKLLCGKGSVLAEPLQATLDSAPEQTLKLSIYDSHLADCKQEMFYDMPASISSSRWLIAETGTLVLWPSASEPRTLSLIPPVHIVVAYASTLHANFATLIHNNQWQAQMPTNVLLISGPSKTADIQQTLAFGAHGPKELIVLLVNDLI
ncbi:lactate utilization protein [Thalassotalea litorea]|uniref:Lactate utilization protein n=2 Tax=Thalassotalea litorea TaxID=2020715 RepID=A0A5R9IUW6_9GAMM|nr:lactate utilization protein [Thalassotalea litorea]